MAKLLKLIDNQKIDYWFLVCLNNGITCDISILSGTIPDSLNKLIIWVTGSRVYGQWTVSLTLSRLREGNMPALILNADISIKVTAMTLKVHDFS